MSIQPGLKRWILIGAVLLAAAGTTIAGIQGTGFRLYAAIGTVETGSGGLQVNGVPYDTSHAHVTVNGRPGDVSELRSGHVVAVHGSRAAKGAAIVADDIVLDSDVRGEVTSVDPAAGSFRVLGQTIQLTDESVLDPRIQPNDVSGLSRGTWVKVSAYQRADGTFIASRVDLDLAPRTLQVRGVARSVDRSHRTLRVGELTVDYSGAKTQGAIAEGAIVIARGIQPQTDGSLFASTLEVVGGVGRAGEHGDVEGIVTAFASATDFEVNGQPVRADSKTVYVLHGQPLGTDLEVRVTGRFDSTGALIAHKVQADAPGKARHGPRK
jgi:hypothetical protein